MLRRNRRDPIRNDGRRFSLGPRGTRILVIAGVIIVIILSYLSAVILIEGARNPAPLPQPAPEEQMAE